MVYGVEYCGVKESGIAILRRVVYSGVPWRGVVSGPFLNSLPVSLPFPPIPLSYALPTSNPQSLGVSGVASRPSENRCPSLLQRLRRVKQRTLGVIS
ncbi:hypothetical protein E2C01_034244 [Portunus trituberculatus]|uniref:Uncharacterized protein n=1 Tax=Portunus trituberculatus TaxID=210409 RepID=A0A5B7F634_PORTR|nr:hypothetical protein [Portunus trituberculatus]